MYITDRTPTEKETDFVRAIKGCRSLITEARHDHVKDIVSHVNRSTLLEILIQNPRIRAKHITGLIPLITDGNELDYLHALAPTIAMPLSIHYGDDHNDQYDLPPVIEILAQFIPSIPSDNAVFKELDLFQTMALFVQNSFYQSTTRKYCNTLIYYLDRGAFDTLSDMDSAREFFAKICNRNWRIWDLWEDEEEEWKLIVERAKVYLAQIDARDTGL